MAAKQGFLMYYSKGDAIGTKVNVRYRRSGRLSGVVVKRGSTVVYYKCDCSCIDKSMQIVLERGFIDKPLTFNIGLLQLIFHTAVFT